jgi:hypothetical protein
MRFRMFLIVLAGLLLFSLATRAQGTRIANVEPLSAKAGELVTANGDGVGSDSVDELYLTNSVQDIKVEMIEQTGKLIKFKVPTGVKPGRWTLMTHLKSGSGPRLIEQPVKLTVEQ